MTSFLEKIYFVLNTAFIFTFEFGYLLFHQNRHKLIKRIAIKLSKINILYIKFFQAVIMNYNLIGNEINNELMQYSDCVPYDLDDINIYLILNIKDKYNLSFMSSYDNSTKYNKKPLSYFKPIKSGMISLVFKLFDKTTRKHVVLKIKRKTIYIFHIF